MAGTSDATGRPLWRGVPPPLEAGVVRALERRPRLPPAQASNLLPATARLYEPLWRRRSLALLTWGGFTVERELELMLRWTAPKPGERWLDAACSAGLYARTLLATEPRLEVHAVDYSLPFLRQAARSLDRAGPELDGVAPTLVQADVAALPYADAAFDGVVCGGSLNEFLDLDGCLAELGRVVRPGGAMWQMYLTDAVGPLSRTAQALARLGGIRFPKAERVEAAATAAGWRLQRAQYRGVVAMAVFERR